MSGPAALRRSAAANTVVLPGTELAMSRLGFGTSALMSRVSRRDSVRLLETALDQGITHFDTARSYGFGAAELAVGDVLQGRRDRITVATKVGILPPRRSSLLTLAKAGARGLLAVAPQLRTHVRRRAGSLVQAGMFTPEVMARSLEDSLRHLRTEYVDLLLLHEPSADVLGTAEPLAFLRRVQGQGKVRCFGIAVTPDVAAYAVEHAPEYVGVLQVPNSVFAPTLRGLKLRPEMAVVTHSSIGSVMHDLQLELSTDAGRAEEWSRLLDTDVRAPGVLERMALQNCLAEVPRGVVLFTSTKPEHIRENAAVLEAAASVEQVDRFARLVQDWMLCR